MSMSDIKSIKEPTKVVQDDIIYILNEEDKTTDIINNDYACGDIFIPRSIKYENSEFIVISILESSFENSKISSIRFPLDSEVRVIEKNAFKSSLLVSINIPRHVTKISEGIFSFCHFLKNIEYHPNSELQVIEKNAFKCSSIESLVIPSSVSELKSGWLNKAG